MRLAQSMASSWHPPGQLRQRMAQGDLVLQAGSEQLVGRRTGLGRGLTAAHRVLSNCNKTKLSVAKILQFQYTSSALKSLLVPLQASSAGTAF